MTLRTYTAMGVLPLTYTPNEKASAYAELFELYSDGKISVAVDTTYGFDEVPRALAALSKSKTLGIHVVRVASDD